MQKIASFLFYFLMSLLLLECIVILILGTAYAINVGIKELLGIDVIERIKRKAGV